MTDWEEHARLLGLTSDKIDKLTSEAFDTLLERIRDGADPRDAVSAIIAAFDPAYREVLAAAFAITLARSVGSAELVSYPVGEVALSQRLYQMAAETSSVVQAIVERHAAGFQDARQLALQIYEGYGFNATEPIKWSRRNPRLPKYMRSELLTDPGLTGDLQRLFARIRVATIKTPALKAGYMEAIDQMEKGKGARLLKKKLKVAFEERMRYHANRIAQTELHRAWVDKQAREIMDDDSIEVVQFKMSDSHPATDICDLFAKQDKYGLGPGMYPKEYAPKPPLHPFCRCGLVSRRQLSARGAKANPASERAYLRTVIKENGVSQAARIVGSKAKLAAALSSSPIEDIINIHRPVPYRLGKVGD